MRVSTFWAAGTAALALTGCSFTIDSDSGPRAERVIPVGSFTGIEVAGPYDVSVRTGSAPGVRATGSDKALDALRVEVKDGTLEVRRATHHGLFNWNWGSWRHNGPVSLVVTVPSLDHAGVAGSGGIKIDKVTGARFKGEIAGSGDLELAAVDAGEVELSIAGSGGIRAGGKARNVKYDIAGSGDIDAAGLTAETAQISIAGSGGVKGHATSTAKVELMGSGDIDLSGGAKCSVSKSGSGNIRCS